MNSNECLQGTHTCNRLFASCNDTRGSFSCSCNIGFFGDGQECSKCPPITNCNGTVTCNVTSRQCVECLPGYFLHALDNGDVLCSGKISQLSKLFSNSHLKESRLSGCADCLCLTNLKLPPACSNVAACTATTGCIGSSDYTCLSCRERHSNPSSLCAGGMYPHNSIAI